MRDAERRRSRAHRSARRLQPHSEIRRRKSRGRCADRQHAGHAAAGRHHPGAELHQPAQPPGAGGARDRARPANAGAAQHGRRAAQAGRPASMCFRWRASWERRSRWSARLRAKAWMRYRISCPRRPPSPEPLELPVVGSTRGYREWAVRVGTNAGYRRPATPVWTARLDSIFLHRIWGPIIFARRRDWRLPDHLCRRAAALESAAEVSRHRPARSWATICPPACSSRCS